jgi:hypothetical protein
VNSCGPTSHKADTNLICVEAVRGESRTDNGSQMRRLHGTLNPQRIFYLVLVSSDSGLTAMALALVRALQLAGGRVGFVKPVAQPGASYGDA